jgi:hypothetical protein
MTGVFELRDTCTLSNANSETKVQAIALQLYSAVVILLAVAFVNVKVHALYDLQVLLPRLIYIKFFASCHICFTNIMSTVTFIGSCTL